MATMVVAGMVGLVSGAAVAACGDTSDTSGSSSSSSSSAPGTSNPVASSSTSPTAPTSTIDVTPYLPLLLDVDVVNAWSVEMGVGVDVGSGVSAITWDDPNPVNEADLSDATGTPCDNTALNPTIIERLRPVTGRQFEPVYSPTSTSTSTPTPTPTSTPGPGPGPNLYQHLIEFLSVGDPTQLGMDMEAMRGAFDGCGERPTWDGAPVSITPLELPESGPTSQNGTIGPLGDQRYAFTVWAMPGMGAGMGTGAGTGAGTGTGPGDGSGYQWGPGDPARIMAPPGTGAVWFVRTAAIRVEGVMITVSLTEIIEVQVPASGIVPDPVPTVTDAQFIALVEQATRLLTE